MGDGEPSFRENIFVHDRHCNHARQLDLVSTQHVNESGAFPPVPTEYSHLRFDASIGEFPLKKPIHPLMAVLMAVNRRINGCINTRSWRY